MGSDSLSGAATASALHERLVAHLTSTVDCAGIHLMTLSRMAGSGDSVLYLRDLDPDEHRESVLTAVATLRNAQPTLDPFTAPGRVLQVEQEIGWKEWLRSSLYQDHFRPMSGARQLVVALNGPSGLPYGFVAVTRTEGDPPFTESDEQLVCALRDQGERVLRAFDIAEDWSTAPVDIVGDLAAALPIPAVLLAPSGKVRWMNQEAEVRLGMVSFAHGAERFYGGPTNALDELVFHARAELDRPGSSLRVDPRPSWLRPHEQLVFRRLEEVGRPKGVLVCIGPVPQPERTPRDMPPPHPALTAREAEVALLAAQGFSVLNIGSKLGVAESTIRDHLKRIYRKLGVCTRAELTWRLWRGES